MPRPPIVQGDPRPVAGVPIEYPTAIVEAHDFIYYVSRVQITDLTIRILDQGFQEIGGYVFDAPPDVDSSDGSLVGTVDGGQPIIIKRDTTCGCRGSRKEPK